MMSTILLGLIFNIGWGTKVLFKNTFMANIKEYYIRYAYVFIGTIISGIATYYVTNFIQICGIVGFCVKAIICVILPNIIYLVLFFRLKEFDSAMAFAKRVAFNILRR